MLFSSLLFLYLFLPITLAGYYLIPYKTKNYWLLLLSLIFFAWGGVSHTVILIASIAVNYFFGRVLQARQGVSAKRWLIVGVGTNVLLLVVFKYADFFTGNLNLLLAGFSVPVLPEPGIALPVGISFYTFHLISYLVDIYRSKSQAQKNIFHLGLYVTMFSQLIAGPIIRYSDVWLQLKERPHSLQKFSSGIAKFLIGLGKKVLLANVFAKVADEVFAGNTADLGAMNAWLGLVCYTLQIYCDFSGYSDMAIGLGRMFGFEFMENFNFPYLATSVKEFWRRWHISLSSFFRDYVYIPLGGNKAGAGRTYVNLFLVFFLTGFWHGANWTFVAWGLMHGVCMVLERLGLEKLLHKVGRPFANIYTLVVVMLAWVLFRADTFEAALNYWSALFDFEWQAQQQSVFFGYADIELCVALTVALLGAFGLFARADAALNYFFGLQNWFTNSVCYVYHVAEVSVYAGILILSSLYLIAGTYNPFIYYQF